MTEQLITKLLEYGIGGIFIAFLIFVIVKLWKAKEARDQYIRDIQKETTKIVSTTSNVMKTLLQQSKTLPEDVKKELDPDIVEIKFGLEQINNKLQL